MAVSSPAGVGSRTDPHGARWWSQPQLVARVQHDDRPVRRAIAGWALLHLRREANGYVRGEGGAFVLKPLSAARRRRPGAIGGAVNNDTVVRLTVPSSGTGRGDPHLRARWGRLPMHYVELHGTGTPVGISRNNSAGGRPGVGRPRMIHPRWIDQITSVT